MTPEEIEDRIKEIFEQNYEMLKLEGGHALTPDVTQSALTQVLYYYRKMRTVAERVTDTEVKLTLPDQLTPDVRRFTIEGIVDIVREDDDVWMYDIKTHDPDYITGNKQFYEKQLNVYAHIYENLRGNKLDHTAIISTAFPANIKAAIASGDVKRIEQELPKWNPLIDIPFDQSKVQATIQDFGAVVDKIETNCFEPPQTLSCLTWLQSCDMPCLNHLVRIDLCLGCNNSHRLTLRNDSFPPIKCHHLPWRHGMNPTPVLDLKDEC
jgi:hypothetical protein